MPRPEYTPGTYMDRFGVSGEEAALGFDNTDPDDFDLDIYNAWKAKRPKEAAELEARRRALGLPNPGDP